MRKYVSRCRHCGIFFFTDPRNECRKDLRCIFGCAKQHRKNESTRRSIEYYRNNKDKKKAQNRKRTDKNLPDPCSPAAIIEKTYQIGQDKVYVETINYLSEIASLIEGEKINSSIILGVLRKKVRQHSMVKMKKADYIVNYLNNKPP